MAGDWIKFELSTLDKPEVCQIADLADIDMDAVVGKLLRVWGWFDQHTENGNAPSVSKRLLDRSVGVTGFCDLMIQVGWMNEIETSEGIVIELPNFERHNGKTAKNRLLTAKRVANCKAVKRQGNDQGNGGSVSGALPREDVEKIKSKEQKPPAVPRKSTKDPIDDSRFDQFWRLYPNRKARAKAEAAWLKLNPSDELLQTLLAALVTQATSHEWTKDGGQYVPHPATWINQRRWEDEVNHASSQQPDRPGPRSAVDEVKQAIEARQAQPVPAGQALAENGGALRPALDGEFRRVG